MHVLGFFFALILVIGLVKGTLAENNLWTLVTDDEQRTFHSEHEILLEPKFDIAFLFQTNK